MQTHQHWLILIDTLIRIKPAATNVLASGLISIETLQKNAPFSSEVSHLRGPRVVVTDSDSFVNRNAIVVVFLRILQGHAPSPPTVIQGPMSAGCLGM